MDFDNVMKDGFKAKQENIAAERLTHLDGKVKVGGSDSACYRKTAFNVMYDPIEVPLETSILMEKGNVGEGVIINVLNALGIKYETQGNYYGVGINSQIEVHPDFLIDLSDPGDPIRDGLKMVNDAIKDGYKFILIEAKTTNAIPSDTHEYWLSQVNMQIRYIANGKKVEPEEIRTFVYALELNNGGHKQFDVEFDQAEVEISELKALSYIDVSEDYHQFMHGEIKEMQYTVFNVIPTYGTICYSCQWAFLCLKERTSIDLPADLDIYASEFKDWKDQEKNMNGKKEYIKDFIKKSNAKEAKSADITAAIRGGNISDTLDIDALTTEEKDEIWKTDMRVYKLNDAAMRKLRPKEYKALMEKHKTTKTSAESLILKRNA